MKSKPSFNNAWYRLIQPLLICTFFGVMMTRLFADYLVPRWELGNAIPLSTASVMDTFAGTDEWLRIRINGVPIGNMRTVVEADPDGPGYHSWLMLDIESPLIRARLESTALLNSRLEMEQVQVNVRWSGEEQADINVTGIVQNRRLLTRIQTPNAVTYRETTLQRPLAMNFAADEILTSSAIQAGETYAMDLFDPVWGLSAGRMRIKLAGQEMITVDNQQRRARIVEASMPTGQMRVWISRDDEILRRAITFGTGEDDRGSASSLVSRIEIRLDAMTPDEIARATPQLGTLPTLPDLDHADLRGADRGDLFGGVGLLPLIFRSQLSQPEPNS